MGGPWTLAIDESGDFAQPEACVCIAGVLLKQEENAYWERIGRFLGNLHPLVTYPPHAADFNLGAFYLARWILADPAVRGKVGPAESRALTTAETIIRRNVVADAWMLREFLSSVQRGSTPKIAALRRCEQWLGIHVGHDLRALADRTRERVRALIAQMVQSSSGLHVLVAAADHGDQERLEGDRYLRLLEALLERVDLLLSRPPCDSVHIRIAIRDVGADGGRLAGRLSREHVEACATSARAAGPPSDRLVPYFVETPSKYDQRVHPSVVLADFAANRLCPVAGGRSGWAGFASDIRHSTGMSVEIASQRWNLAPDAPSVAAQGAARHAIVESFRGDVPRVRELLGSAPSGWARDQALNWTAVAARVRLARGRR